jgi:hypothetical protein
MTSARNQALAVLGLSATPDADTPVIQSAFERLARRYPQPHFPERFRQLLEARDQLLEAGRGWREQLENRTLDLAWMVPHLKLPTPESIPQRRVALQDLLRAGYLAEPLAPSDDSP